MKYDLFSMRMTFTIPDPVARGLKNFVPGGERSALLARLLEEELRRRKELLVKACHDANADQEVKKTIGEWQGFDEKVDEKGW